MRKIITLEDLAAEQRIVSSIRRMARGTQLGQRDLVLPTVRYGGAGGGAAGIVFDMASEAASRYQGTGPLETASWTIGSGSNRYLVAFGVGGEFAAGAAPADIRHSGSGGTSLTALHAAVAANSGAGRAFGMAAPPSGAGTTWADWTTEPPLLGLVALAYRGVSGVGTIASSTLDDSTDPSVISVDVSTPNTTDVVAGIAWMVGFSGTPTAAPGSGCVSRGIPSSPPNNVMTYIALERARTGSTTTISASFSGFGAGTYRMGIIGVPLEAAP